MRIGLVYDLKDDYLARGWTPAEAAEFDSRATIDALEAALVRAGHAVARVGGLVDLVGALARGASWDLVFNIAEGARGSARESQVPGLLEAYGLACTFSDAATLALCLDKAAAKRAVRDAGVPTPAFAVVREPEDEARVGLPFPLFAKPLAEGSSKGVSAASRVESASGLWDVCADLLAAHGQPVLVEEYLPGREFTVGLLGAGADTRVLGVMEIVFAHEDAGGLYSMATKTDYARLVRYELAAGPLRDACARAACAAWRALGGRDAGRIDLRLDAGGRPHFLEANPLPGLSPTYSDLPILCGLAGITYDSLIRGIVDEAAPRVAARG